MADLVDLANAELKSSPIFLLEEKVAYDHVRGFSMTYAFITSVYLKCLDEFKRDMMAWDTSLSDLTLQNRPSPATAPAAEPINKEWTLQYLAETTTENRDTQYYQYLLKLCSLRKLPRGSGPSSEEIPSNPLLEPFKFVDTNEGLMEFLSALENSPRGTDTNPEYFRDCEGWNLSRIGALSLFQIYIRSLGQTWVLDVTVLDTRTFDTIALALSHAHYARYWRMPQHLLYSLTSGMIRTHSTITMASTCKESLTCS
ncbi:uncharacterized protein BP5553_09973 [Venustampulla echinocandica]|uniref:Uncharacterized protein n=1 Tax=Venustampulla echinocandica TaxID=2656787 RepID=A0A370TB79_9HELO|nr:uncharacterized protein BP5553_09973 [Venustampulla echinocandica]RDL31184.1 hypothetical protein BP5553_09973 [Venustampulla echinocandica]